MSLCFVDASSAGVVLDRLGSSSLLAPLFCVGGFYAVRRIESLVCRRLPSQRHRRSTSRASGTTSPPTFQHPSGPTYLDDRECRSLAQLLHALKVHAWAGGGNTDDVREGIPPQLTGRGPRARYEQTLCSETWSLWKDPTNVPMAVSSALRVSPTRRPGFSACPVCSDPRLARSRVQSRCWSCASPTRT